MRKTVYYTICFGSDCGCVVIFDHFPTLKELEDKFCLGLIKEKGKQYYWSSGWIHIIRTTIDEILNKDYDEIEGETVLMIEDCKLYEPKELVNLWRKARERA